MYSIEPHSHGLPGTVLGWARVRAGAGVRVVVKAVVRAGVRAGARTEAKDRVRGVTRIRAAYQAQLSDHTMSMFRCVCVCVSRLVSTSCGGYKLGRAGQG